MGILLRVIIFAPHDGAKFVSPRFNRGKLGVGDGRHTELSVFVNITPGPDAVYSNLQEVFMDLIDQS
jgi:hypothetical protein